MSNPQQVARQEPKRDLRMLLRSDAVKEQIALALPKHMTPDRMMRVALTTINSNPKLLDCTPESVLGSLMRCSQVGLEPDGRNAHLIPYGNQCQVIFDWKGLVTLARRNGVQVTVDVVCDKDTFVVQKDDGTGRSSVHHQINYREPRGEVYAAYSRAKIGEEVDYEIMTKDEIEYVRRTFSRGKDADAWRLSWNEMAKKTVIRRHSKRWPLDPEIAQAFDQEDPAEVTSAPIPKAEFSGPPMALPEPKPESEQNPVPKQDKPAAKTAEKPVEKPAQKASEKAPEPAKATDRPSEAQKPQEAPAQQQGTPVKSKPTLVEQPLSPEEDRQLNGTAAAATSGTEKPQEPPPAKTEEQELAEAGLAPAKPEAPPAAEAPAAPVEDPRWEPRDTDSEGVKSIRLLCKQNNVPLAQLEKWLDNVHLLKAGQKHVEELSTAKVDGILRNFQRKLEDIKAAK